jgi:hypothetical protein
MTFHQGFFIFLWAVHFAGDRDNSEEPVAEGVHYLLPRRDEHTFVLHAAHSLPRLFCDYLPGGGQVGK